MTQASHDTQGMDATAGSAPRMVTGPRTTLGRWSLYLLAAFGALMFLFFVTIAACGGFGEVSRWSMERGGGFFSLPGIAGILVAAAAAAAAAALTALVAIIRRRERSLVLLLPLAVGTIVMLFAIGEMFEGR